MLEIEAVESRVVVDDVDLRKSSGFPFHFRKELGIWFDDSGDERDDDGVGRTESTDVEFGELSFRSLREKSRSARFDEGRERRTGE